MMHQKLPLYLDIQLIIPVLVLLTLSLITLFSIDITFFRYQLLFTFTSILVFLFVSQIDYRSLEILSVPIYFGSLLCLLVVLVLGYSSRGAVRWLALFGFSVQFSEILKPLLTISLASFLAKKNSISHTVSLQVLLYVIPIAFLIYRQPDLGNALIYLGTVILTLLVFGFPFRWFFAGFIAILGCLPFVWRNLHEYQRARLLTFFHITNDPLGISYNAIQSVIAVGSGSLFGKGLGQGTQSGLRFLPERHTDFIFATLSEELGFIGSLIILIAFCFLFFRLYRIFMESNNLFSRVFIAACFFLMFIQCIANIGMNIGIMPIVGVTLPFVSYGGSSLLSNALFLGIVSAMGRYAKSRNVLEIA